MFNIFDIFGVKFTLCHHVNVIYLSAESVAVGCWIIIRVHCGNATVEFPRLMSDISVETYVSILFILRVMFTIIDLSLY